MATGLAVAAAGIVVFNVSYLDWVNPDDAEPIPAVGAPPCPRVAMIERELCIPQRPSG